MHVIDVSVRDESVGGVSMLAARLLRLNVQCGNAPASRLRARPP
jgi:hypothetical protein